MMLLRQRPGGFYTYPDHRSWMRKLLWRLGFDPLTVYERLAQTDRERQYWKEQAMERNVIVTPGPLVVEGGEQWPKIGHRPNPNMDPADRDDLLRRNEGTYPHRVEWRDLSDCTCSTGTSLGCPIHDPGHYVENLDGD